MYFILNIEYTTSCQYITYSTMKNYEKSLDEECNFQQMDKGHNNFIISIQTICNELFLPLCPCYFVVYLAWKRRLWTFVVPMSCEDTC